MLLEWVFSTQRSFDHLNGSSITKYQLNQNSSHKPVNRIQLVPSHHTVLLYTVKNQVSASQPSNIVVILSHTSLGTCKFLVVRTTD